MRWGENSLYKQVLLHTAPKLARVPLTTTRGLPLYASRQQIARHKMVDKYWRRWHKKAHRLSAGLIPPVRRTGYGVDYDTWLKNELRGWTESILLDPRTLGRGYWNPSAVEQLVEDHRLGRGRQLEKKLTALITFELWHRMYMDRSDIAILVAARPSSALEI
jgi:asparagine synthase (glutamine-hydrolysing)